MPTQVNIGSDLNKDFYKTYNQYQATVYAWGVNPDIMYQNAAIRYAKTALFGGSVGHASMDLTFPVNEENKKLINTYIAAHNIPHKIITEEGQQFYKVYFSVWPSNTATIRFSDSLIADQIDERYGVNYQYKEHDSNFGTEKATFDPWQKVTTTTTGLFTGLKREINLPPIINIAYQRFDHQPNEQEIKQLINKITTIHINDILKATSTQQLENLINTIIEKTKTVSQENSPLIKTLLKFKCLELKMVSIEKDMYRYAQELGQINKEAYTSSVKSIAASSKEFTTDFSELVDDGDDEPNPIKAIAAIIAVGRMVVDGIKIVDETWRHTKNTFNANKVNMLSTETHKLTPNRNAILEQTAIIKKIDEAKKVRASLREAINNLHNQSCKELNINRYITIGYQPHSVSNIPIYNPNMANSVGLNLKEMLEKMAEIATKPKSFNLFSHNCASTVLDVLSSGTEIKCLKSTCSKVLPIPHSVRNSANDIENYMKITGIDKNEYKSIRSAIQKLRHTQKPIMMIKFTNVLNQIQQIFSNMLKHVKNIKANTKKLLFSKTQSEEKIDKKTPSPTRSLENRNDINKNSNK